MHKHKLKLKTRRSKERSDRVVALSFLLWDETKPEGEEGIPEDQWVTILTGPCNGDELLIDEVCAYERWLRSDQDDAAVVLNFSPDRYTEFVQSFFDVRNMQVGRLWDKSAQDWYPEELWEDLLVSASIPGISESHTRDSTMDLARRLRAARGEGRFVLLK